VIADESLANIERTVRMLSTTQDDFDERPAVIAAPQWWIDEISRACGGKKVEATDLLDEIHGCKVVAREDIAEPFTISADGRLFPVLPDWARRANRGETQ